MEGPTSSAKSDLGKSASNQNANKANGNKRKKNKNQRKKSNATVSSAAATTTAAAATITSSSLAVAKKTKNDLPSPTVTQQKGLEEKKKLKAESPKASPVAPASTKSPTTSPQSGSKQLSVECEPKCQIVPDHPKAEDSAVSNSKTVPPKEEDKSTSTTSVTGEAVQCNAIEETSTANQINSSAAPSSDNQESQKQPNAENSSCELTKPCSESSLATEAPTNQSMDDANLKTKPNGASGKSFVQNGTADSKTCKICSKHVYHMEQIKAEKGVFHKACFRCQECNKQLTVDSYSSHEGIIYCKPHFKQLFQPKPVIENNSSQKPTRKYELIICENTPQELPADVVRSSTKQDDVFENINLDLSNIRNRFENGSDKLNDNTDSKKSKPITRSESIHKIMQKYQSRVAGDKEITSSSDEEDNTAANASDAKADEQSEKLEKVSFTGMSALKSQWESGTIKANNKSESRVEEELAELRQKVKTSEPLKQAYERAIQEAKSVENLAPKSESILVDSSVKAVSIKEKFEKGKVDLETEEDRIERLRKEREEEISRIAVSETSTKEARNKFKQIEANMGKDQVSNGSNGHIEESISSNELQQRIKNFENLKDIQSAKEASGDETDAKTVDEIPKADTTKKMLDKFKALEANASQSNNSQMNGVPKSPIRITPPRETGKVTYESAPAAERDPNIIKSSYKSEDDIQVEPEKAKNLRAKFENWQTEIERESRKSENEDEYVPHIDTTKNLRAKFESIKDEYKPVEKPRPRINRFVDSKAPPGEVCYVCSSRLYPMEKMEFSGIKIHKNCFRCNKCHTPLRLDNFTVRAEKLFCIPHFKQLFMEKGNYDEGFGMEQHKDKWSNKAPSAPAPINGGKTNGVEKLDEGLNSSNGNGVHDDDDDGDLVEHLGASSTEGDDEQPYSHEEPEEHDDLEVLQHQVDHIELDEVLDGPIAVDNQV